MEKIENVFSVSDFVALTNQTLEYAYGSVRIEGEIANFKVNQNKYVFFDIKDKGASVGCFMSVWHLRQPLEDGMNVVITAAPKLTPWGKFSLTVRTVEPKGEGTIKRAFDLLKASLEKEGLFATSRKRALPEIPRHVAVISSTQAAGYADFMKIAERWGGVQFDVAHVQVQGAPAADQIIAAIEYFNTLEVLPEVLVIVRGGGSADDLAVFNDERLVRAVAASRIPTLVGIGHEVDTVLAELAADVRASTPSNAAQLLLPDREEMKQRLRYGLQSVVPRVEQAVEQQTAEVRRSLHSALESISYQYERAVEEISTQRELLMALNPHAVLARGYAVLRGSARIGERVTIETQETIIQAEVQNVRTK